MNTKYIERKLKNVKKGFFCNFGTKTRKMTILGGAFFRSVMLLSTDGYVHNSNLIFSIHCDRQHEGVSIEYGTLPLKKYLPMPFCSKCTTPNMALHPNLSITMK